MGKLVRKVLAAFLICVASFLVLDGEAFATGENLYEINLYSKATYSDLTDLDFDSLDWLYDNGLLYAEFDDDEPILYWYYAEDDKVILEVRCDENYDCDNGAFEIPASLDAEDNRTFLFADYDLDYVADYYPGLTDYDGVHLNLVEESEEPCDSVCITSVRLLETSDDATQNERPEIDDLNTNLNVYLQSVGNFVKYEITVKNATDKGYGIEIEGIDDDFIDYDVQMDGSDLPTGSEKTIAITIAYRRTIPKSELDADRNYVGSFKINLVSEDASSPNTGDGIATVAIIAFASGAIVLILARDKHRRRGVLAVAVAAVGASAIATGAYALAEYQINVSVKIEVRPSITFVANADDVTGSMPDQFFVPGEDFILNDSTFERENYRQYAWNTSPDGSGDNYNTFERYAFDETTVYIPVQANFDDDITLYAMWERAIYVGTSADGRTAYISDLPTADAQITRWSLTLKTQRCNIWGAFSSCSGDNSYIKKVTNVEISGHLAPESYAWWFAYLGQSLTTNDTVELDLSSLDTSNATSMARMFSYAGGSASLWTITGTDNWDTSNVTNMESMFYATGGGMNSRFYLDISSFNMSKVEDLTGFLDYAGYQANDWTVIIPATNGNGIQNTTTRIYGANESVYYDLPSGREFTIAD